MKQVDILKPYVMLNSCHWGIIYYKICGYILEIKNSSGKTGY